MPEHILAGLGSLLLVLLPEGRDLIIRAFTDRALSRVAHPLDRPKGTFVVHIQLISFEKWSALEKLCYSRLLLTSRASDGSSGSTLATSQLASIFQKAGLTQGH